ncbi:hypothetical protein V5O48_013396 [Marasmius crinis-equi]|uniref:F-box domain-containing protein n=1 Tax=Marasmius crinis-equi TaxID=585013 RepID=A0ABR3F071_9AGAR
MSCMSPDAQLHAAMAPNDLLEMLRAPHASFFSTQDTSKWIQHAQSDLLKYEKQIQQHQSHIQQLRAKQVALRRDIARYSSLSSPVRKLPSEILRRIFGLASLHNRFGKGPFLEEWSSGAFIMGSICSRWREIAINAPELWSSISFRFEERAFRPVQLCLSRSGNHHLNLDVDSGLYDYDDDEEFREIEGFCRVLTEHRTRWRHLNVAHAGSTLIPYMVNRSRTETPSLESITCCEWNIEDLRSCLLGPGARTIQDVSISFKDRLAPFTSISDVFPWRTMRHLEMDYDGQETLDGLCEALRLGGNLQSLTYTGMAYTNEDGPYEGTSGRFRDHVRVVSNIKSLTIAFYDLEGFYGILHDLFRSCTLPSLTSLTISCPDNHYKFPQKDYLGGIWPYRLLNECLELSGCTLTTLTLGGLLLLEPEVVSLLHSAPSIHSFTLSELGATTTYGNPPEYLPQTITKSLLKRLHGTMLSDDVFSIQHPILTKLTFLKLQAQFRFDADEEFVDLVKSRWFKPDGSSPSGDTERLRTVVLHVRNRKLLPDTYLPLTWIESDGMMVSVLNDEQRII